MSTSPPTREMMLGEMRLEGKMYGRGEPTLVSNRRDLAEQLAEAIALLPRDVFKPEVRRVVPPTLAQSFPAPEHIKPNAYTLVNDQIARLSTLAFAHPPAVRSPPAPHCAVPPRLHCPHHFSSSLCQWRPSPAVRLPFHLLQKSKFCFRFYHITYHQPPAASPPRFPITLLPLLSPFPYFPLYPSLIPHHPLLLLYLSSSFIPSLLYFLFNHLFPSPSSSSSSP